MKRKFNLICNNNTFEPQLKKRKIEDKQENILNHFFEKLININNNLNNINNTINDLNKRLTNIEKFIEENTQPKLPPLNNYSYFY